jgi:hypothetical protein
MLSIALAEARRKREEAHAAVEAHDQGCGECDVRRHRRCEQGMALVRASWAAQKAVDDELARQREPDPGPTLSDFGYLSLPGEIRGGDRER